jgi:hypothetical protein
MSSKLINVDLIYDSTWEYEVTSGEDKPVALLSYKDEFEGWADRCPVVNTPHPDISSLKLHKIKATREPGGLIKVDLHYIAMTHADLPGRPAEGAEPTAKYYVQVGSREEHILTNAFAAELVAEEITALYALSNGTLQDPNGASFRDQITSEVGLALLAKIEKGNTHYRTGSIIYGERKVIEDLADLELSLFGKQYMPPGPVGGDAVNWLYSSASADPVPTDDEAWQMDRQWEYSPDGWDDDLYAPPL